MTHKSMPSAAASQACTPAAPAATPQPRDLSALTQDRAADGPPDIASASAAFMNSSGCLRFELKRDAAGVHVMRIHRRDDGAKIHCSVLFDNERSFLEWVDADPLRFAHPLVFQQVRRGFAHLMAERAHHDAVRT
jgi:hypothetical protein